MLGAASISQSKRVGDPSKALSNQDISWFVLDRIFKGLRRKSIPKVTLKERTKMVLDQLHMKKYVVNNLHLVISKDRTEVAFI